LLRRRVRPHRPSSGRNLLNFQVGNFGTVIP